MATVFDYPQPHAGFGLGFLRLQTPGDLEPETVCRNCGKSLANELAGGVWVQAISKGEGGVRWAAPYCAACVKILSDSMP